MFKIENVFKLEFLFTSVELLDCMALKCHTFVSLLVKVSQKQTRMALRKPRNKDVGEVPPGDQQEDESLDDRDDNVKLLVRISYMLRLRFQLLKLGICCSSLSFMVVDEEWVFV